MNNRKFKLSIVLLIALAIIITGCGSKNTSSDMAPNENFTASQEEMGYPEDEVAEDSSADKGDSFEPDKIITTVYIEMQTKEFATTTKKLESLINKYKGYIENSNISYNDYVYSTGLKYSDYTIRIPREKLEPFVDDIIEIGNIISQNKNKQDVTKQYRDTESRLRVLNTKEERILALLEKAEKMEDIIVLENQLSDVIYQKETLTQDLTSMDDKVDYSTVDLNLEEVAKLTSGQSSKTPFMEKLKTAFKDSFYFFTRNTGDILISFIYLLPYVIILAVVGFIGYELFKRKKKVPKDKDRE